MALTSGAALAADVTMVVDNQSWLNTNVWSDGLAPSTSNDYFTAAVGGGFLRTSPAGTTAGGAADFPGNSLTVVAGTRLLIKQENAEVGSINGGAANLIVDGGTVGFGPNSSGGPHSNTLDINELQITSTAGAVLDININTAVATIDGTLTGSGNVLINYSNAGTSSNRTLSIAAVDPAYAGAITVDEGVILDFGSTVDLAGSLALLGTSKLNVDQNITIEGGKLTDANGFVPGGTYTGGDITALGANFVDAGGTLTVTASDSDLDGLNDFWEDLYFGDNSGTVEPSDLTSARGTQAQNPSGGADWDNDSDGADNETEENAQTDPTVPDTDADGLNDGPEIDGSLNGYNEFGAYVGVGSGGAPTDPLDTDSDDDGILDGEEVAAGADGFFTDPNTEDTDFDFLLDAWEIAYGLDPTDDGFINVVTGDSGNPDNGDLGDPDSDNLDNFNEQTAGTDPLDPDTDDDGLLDGDELSVYFTDPLVADSDGDGLNDGQEVGLGSNPNLRDSDSDTFSDDLEFAEGTSLTDAGDFPAGFITVTNSVAGITVPNAASDGSGLILTTASFDMTGGNAVALCLTAEFLSGVFPSGTTPLITASFAGQSMDSAVAARTTSGGSQVSYIFYLIDPTVTVGTFTVTADPNLADVDLAYSQIALASVPGVTAIRVIDVDAPQSGNNPPLNLSYATSTNDGFVLGAAVNNDSTGTASRRLSIAYGNPDTDLLRSTIVESSGHFHTYGRTGVAGPQTDGYLGQYSRTAIVTVVFGTPPPEPIRLVSAGFNGAAFEITFENLSTATSYQLERSAPGLDAFSPIGSPVTPASSTNTFSDPTPPATSAFYRLSFP